MLGSARLVVYLERVYLLSNKASRGAILKRQLPGSMKDLGVDVQSSGAAPSRAPQVYLLLLGSEATGK